MGGFLLAFLVLSFQMMDAFKGPEAAQVTGIFLREWRLEAQENQNLYAHQSVSLARSSLSCLGALQLRIASLNPVLSPVWAGKMGTGPSGTAAFVSWRLETHPPFLRASPARCPPETLRSP